MTHAKYVGVYGTVAHSSFELNLFSTRNDCTASDLLQFGVAQPANVVYTFAAVLVSYDWVRADHSTVPFHPTTRA